jgi:arylsulfatase A-like enzyme
VIVRWPGKIEAGSESAEPLISNDFYPTLLDLAGVPMEPGQHVDGVSFGEVLLGKAETVSREALYWHYPHGRHEAAVRAGRYKLLQRFEKDEVELYDLEADAGERVDMSEEKPALAAELLAQLKGWQKGVGARFAGEKLDTREAAAKPHLDETARFNVLFIAADDWNDWVGCLGDGQAQTPHVDGLAARGMLFTNAHCAAPVCNPSRAATLTGLRPDTTGVYENNHRLRKLAPEVVTLPQYFRENGYHVAGGGKIFHDVPPHCDDPLSWDEYFWWNEHGPKGGRAGGAWRSPYSISPDPELPGRPIRKIAAATKRNFEWGAVDEAEENWPDHQVATWASDFLEREHEEPFFLAVGIFRPHVPWFNPKKYFEMYPLERVVLPEVKADDLDDVGEWARRRARDGNSKHEKVVEFGEWEAAVQAYLASISHADANIGRVLEALAGSAYADDTIIVFWSDHGYHLGEKEHWHKRTLWERATHVPVIVVAPGVTEAGARCSRPVNLLDLYPTLVELCGLEVREELEGRSLVPLLEDSKVKWPHASVTTYLKGNHAVRTEDWRYIRYGTGEEELYDHRSDLHEWENLAGRPEYQGRLRKMNVFLKGLSE